MVRSARLNLPARLRDAEERADAAVAGRREAHLIASVACALLDGPADDPDVRGRVEAAVSDAGLRLERGHAPCPQQGEIALPLRMRAGSGWLYVRREGSWTRADAERIATRLAQLLDQAQERSDATGAAAEAEAGRRTEVAKGAILHAISHDLRQPLTAVATAAQELRRPHVSDADRLRLADSIAAEAADLERLVADLADLARIRAGAVNPQPEPCDLKATVGRAWERVRAARGEHDVRFDLPDDLPLVHADGAQLERVFANLIDNAIEFSPGNAPVEIRGVAANGRVTLRVVDQGRAIEAARHSDVFEPFVRGGGQGPGLGLAICRGFVEANGGRMTLQSRARDGSAFAVTLPVARERTPV
jgi:two-component system sensor histidine kinase KdpD